MSILLVVGGVSPTCDLVTKTVINKLLNKLPLARAMGIVASNIGSIAPTVVHVLATKMLSNILVGAKTTAAVSGTVVGALKRGQMFTTLTLTAVLLYTINIFVSITIVAMTPVTLSVKGHLNLSSSMLLVTVVNKKGYNGVISPGPGAVVTTRGFGTSLSSIVFCGVLPTVVKLIFAIFIVVHLVPRGLAVITPKRRRVASSGRLPSLADDLVTPFIAVVLLTLQPLTNVAVSPLVTLPVNKVYNVLYVGR